MTKLNFIFNTLDLAKIENLILSLYSLGETISSDFGTIEVGIRKKNNIITKKGKIKFFSTVVKTKDNNYSITIQPIEVKYKK